MRSGKLRWRRRALRVRHRRRRRLRISPYTLFAPATDVFRSACREEKSGCRAERAMRSNTVRRKSHYFGIRSDIFMALAAALSSERSSLRAFACLHCASIAAVNRESAGIFFHFCATRAGTRVAEI